MRYELAYSANNLEEKHTVSSLRENEQTDGGLYPCIVQRLHPKRKV